MATNDQRRSVIAAHPLISAGIAIGLAADIFFALYTPIYARITPRLGDFPFFYWYLLIFMPVTSAVLWLVTQLQKHLDAPLDGPGETQ
jgi:drug/metabolite transporter (DMT)-like permease